MIKKLVRKTLEKYSQKTLINMVLFRQRALVDYERSDRHLRERNDFLEKTAKESDQLIFEKDTEIRELKEKQVLNEHSINDLTNRLDSALQSIGGLEDQLKKSELQRQRNADGFKRRREQLNQERWEAVCRADTAEEQLKIYKGIHLLDLKRHKIKVKV